MIEKQSSSTVGLRNTDGTRVNPATEGTVSQLVMAINNAIDQTAFDVNAAPFSATTNIVNDYILDNIELNFSTAETKTITVTSADGTIIWGGSVDTSASNLGYNTTKQHFFLTFDRGFNANENITVAVTQTAGACSMDCIVKTKSGTNTLAGNPLVYLASGDDDTLADVDQYVNALRIIVTEHGKVHDGKYFFAGNDIVVTDGSTHDILLKNPAGNFPHLRNFSIHSTAAPVNVSLYEGTTVSADGTTLTAFNANRNSATTSSLALYTGPTVTSVGTRLYPDAITGEKTVGGSTPDHVNELILKANENYLLRLQNGSGIDTDFIYQITWYE